MHFLKLREFNLSSRLIFTYLLTVRILYFSLVPFFFVFVLEIGYSNYNASFVAIIPVLLTSVTSFFLIAVKNIFSKHAALKLSCGLFPVSFLLLIFGGHSLVIIYASAITIGFVAGIAESNSQVFFATTKDQSSKLYVIRYYIINLGALLGPLIGICIFDNFWGFWDFLIPISTILVAIFLYFWVDKIIFEEDKQKPIFASFTADLFFKNHLFAIAIASFFLILIAYSQVTTTFGDYFLSALNFNASSLGYFVSAHAFIILTVSPFLMRFFSNDKIDLLLMLGGIVMFLAFLLPLVYLTTDLDAELTVLGILIFYTIGEIFLFPISNLLIIKSRISISADIAAAYFNLTRVGLLVGPVLGVMLIEEAGFINFVAFVSLLLAVGVFGMFKVSRNV